MIDEEKLPTEVFAELSEDTERLWEHYEYLRSYNISKVETLRAIRIKYKEDLDNTQLSVTHAEPDDINSEKVGHLKHRLDLNEMGREMQGEAGYVVYFLKCDLHGEGTLGEAKKKACDLLPSVDEAPDWVYHAWKADDIYYVGQTSNFGDRLKAHCDNHRSESTPALRPSMLSAISTVRRAGIIERVEDRDYAKEIEESVHKQWSREDTSRFVYSA